MNARIARFFGRSFGTLMLAVALSGAAQNVQLVTAIPASQRFSRSDGDSYGGVISRSGRYVAFASTADNLLAGTNSAAPTPQALPTLNVYLRDRTNGTTTLVSINAAGLAGGNGDSLPVDVSDDGRFVLFESFAGNLVAADTNNRPDVFLRDLTLGVTSLVSARPDGSSGNGGSRMPSMTPDARFITFASSASDLVPGDTNRIADIFMREMQTGSTVLISPGAALRTTSVVIGSSEAPEITPDGRYVLFQSTATNVVPGVPAGGDIYVRDTQAGVTAWASAGARTALHTPANASLFCFNQRISDDGAFVVYEASIAPTGPSRPAGAILRYGLGSGATEIIHTNAVVPIASYEDAQSLDISADGRFVVFSANTNGTAVTNACLLVWDGNTGSLTLATVSPGGQLTSGTICDWPTIDQSGRYVAFLGRAENLVTNTVAKGFHTYFRDLQEGVTTLMDGDTNLLAEALSPATTPQFNDSAASVVFDCPDGGLLPNDSNKSQDVFVRDRVSGGIELISVANSNSFSVTPHGPSLLGAGSISYDGQRIALASDADDLVANDTNLFRDVFLRDLVTDSYMLVSRGTNGGANGASYDPAISPDGRFVAFTSTANNLVAGDNAGSDVFLVDTVEGTTALVSANRFNTAPGNNSSYSPAVSRDGRFVIFRSRATDLAPGTFSGTSDNVFLRDMVARTNLALSSPSGGPAAMTPDGAFIVSTSPTAAWKLSVWSTAARAFVYYDLNSSTIATNVTISADGRRIAYSVTPGLYAVDLTTSNKTTLEPAFGIGYTNLQMDAAGRLLVCAKRPVLNGTNQVYLYDLEAGTNLLLSRNYSLPVPGNAPSDSTSISADGRFVIFRSAASDLVPGDTNGVNDIFIYDLRYGSNLLVSGVGPADLPANSHSTAPLFSGDGRSVFFQSRASDLISWDLNRASDIFAYPLAYVALYGEWISWPWLPNRDYRVESKDALDDAPWQERATGYTNSMYRGWWHDPDPASGQRWYRLKVN